MTTTTQFAAHQAADPHCSCNDCLATLETPSTPTHLDLSLVPDLHVQVDYYGHPKIGRVTGITKRTVTVEIHVGKGRRHYVREFTKNIRSGYVFAPFSLNSDRDILTRGITSFESFDALVNAKGGYRPTLLGAGLFDILANTYDRYQRVRGDDRRAYRRNVEW